MSLPNVAGYQGVEVASSRSMLLDLPTEIFTCIITDVIREVGITGAWRLRKVCETFQIYIEQEILGDMPLEEFYIEGRKIIRDNLEKCLLMRCLAGPKKLATNPLPLFISELADTILSDFPPEDDARNLTEIRHGYLSDLIRLVAKKNGTSIVAFDYYLQPSGCKWADVGHMSGKANPNDSLTDSQLEISHLVIAAAAVGNLTAVNNYLGQDPEAAFAELLHFHRPLESAVNTDRLDVALAIIDHFKSTLMNQPEYGGYQKDRSRAGSYHWHTDKIFRHLESAIHEAIGRKNVKMLQLLLDFEFNYYSYDSGRVSDLLFAVTKSGSLDLVKVIAGFKRKDDDESYPDGGWWEEACLGNDKSGSPQIVRYLLETRIATTSELQYNCQGYGRETPLHWVAKAGKGRIAKILIEFGADIDYHGHEYRWKPTPLKTAAYFGNLEVAQVLINAGANVSFGNPLTAVFNCKRRERDKIFDTTRTFAITQALLRGGTPVTRKVAVAIEQEAKLMVMSRDRWLDGNLDREYVMALVTVAKRLMETVPRWRIPYADFYIRSREARKLLDAQEPQWRYGSKRGTARCWPDMYFLSRVLRNVAWGNLRKLIPRKRKYLIADARAALCWLEDWRV